MRVSLVILLAAALAACGGGGSPGADGAAIDGVIIDGPPRIDSRPLPDGITISDGPPPDAAGDATIMACDDRGACQPCVDCANANNCQPQATACIGETACVEALQCMNACGGVRACVDQCLVDHPAGVPYLTCMFCQACPNDCAGTITCP